MEKINSSEITPEPAYLNRRNFIRAGLIAGTTTATGLSYRLLNPPQPPAAETAAFEEPLKQAEISIPETEKANSFEEITNYNNYYEFSTSKTGVARAAKDFQTRPWQVEVGGLVNKPRIFGIEDILKFDQEERIYRFRCVEGWSMVIPWVGFPLSKLLSLAEPLGKAKYAAFETYFDKIQMPNWRFAGISLPYVEGLRLDEAMHPLTILATGLYGKQMPNQNGAPVRLVVPWKYGFKSIKSVVKITLTENEPPTTWNLAIPNEYGFYSNVNPEVSHPRWSQATERRIGELIPRKTVLFNGYAEQVEGLYSGMDLRKFF